MDTRKLFEEAKSYPWNRILLEALLLLVFVLSSTRLLRH